MEAAGDDCLVAPDPAMVQGRRDRSQAVSRHDLGNLSIRLEGETLRLRRSLGRSATWPVRLAAGQAVSGDVGCRILKSLLRH